MRTQQFALPNRRGAHHTVQHRNTVKHPLKHAARPKSAACSRSKRQTLPIAKPTRKFRGPEKTRRVRGPECDRAFPMVRDRRHALSSVSRRFSGADAKRIRSPQSPAAQTSRLRHRGAVPRQRKLLAAAEHAQPAHPQRVLRVSSTFQPQVFDVVDVAGRLGDQRAVAENLQIEIAECLAEERSRPRRSRRSRRRPCG